jgi:N-acetylmuramoyl-L-alanine amidase
MKLTNIFKIAYLWPAWFDKLTTSGAKLREQVLAILVCVLFISQAHGFTIILDPAGDAQHAGRSLHDIFERGATFAFAQELKFQLNVAYPNVTVILSHQANDNVTSLQTASFANSLNIDLLLSINFYKEINTKPSIYLYYFKNQTFFSKYSTNQLSFLPYQQAFIFNFDQTQKWVNHLQQKLQKNEYKHYFECHPGLAMPFKPLAGIKAPSIGLEIGIKQNGWELYLTPIVTSLAGIIYEK